MTSPLAIQHLFSVTQKNILITGSSRGIGFHLAQGFVSNGANVILTSRDEEACARAAMKLRQATSSNSIKIHSLVSSIITPEGCNELVSHTEELFDGELDVLVNCAGCAWGEELYDYEHDSHAKWGWEKVMNVNVGAVMWLTRACVPLLQRQKGQVTDNGIIERSAVEDPGRVLNIGSVAGILPQEAPTHVYDVSKAAVHHLTLKMAGELAPRGITVNCLAPGYVPTRMSKGLAAWGASTKKMEKHIPLRRMGDKMDMSGAAIYFCSRAGAWCTGVVLNVDGGAVGTSVIPLRSL